MTIVEVEARCDLCEKALKTYTMRELWKRVLCPECYQTAFARVEALANLILGPREEFEAYLDSFSGYMEMRHGGTKNKTDEDVAS